MSHIVYSFDRSMVSLFENVGRSYQYLTGKSKDILALRTFQAAGTLNYASMILGYDTSILESKLTIPAADFLGDITTGALVGTLCFIEARHLNNQMVLTEKVENRMHPVEPYLYFFATFGTFYSRIPFEIILLGLALSDKNYVKFWQEVGEISFTLGTLGFIAGRYLEKINIEPPSGKSLLSRIKESAQHYIQGLNKQPQPGYG